VSIKIDRKEFRQVIPVYEPKVSPYLDVARAFALRFNLHVVGQREMSYDGEWVRLNQIVTGQYPVLAQTGHSVQRRTQLYARARGYATDDTSIHWFFLEPAKGVYGDYQGIRHDDTYHCVESRSGGVETQTNLTGQDWTVETEFAIAHWYDQTETRFYINGALVATHTTNISAQPYEILFGEPSGVARVIYMRYPYGITLM